MPQKPFKPSPNEDTDPFDLRYNKDEPSPETPAEAPRSSAETVRSFNLLQEIRERLQRLESSTAGPADLSGQTGELITSLKADRDRANELLTEARRELGKQEEKCRVLRKQVDFVQKKYVERNKRVAGLKVELSEARKQAEAALAELRQRPAEQQPSEDLQAELEQARRRCAELEGEIAELRTLQAELQQQIARHDQEAADLREASEHERQSLQAQLDEARQEQSRHEQSCHDLQEQFTLARSECSERDQRIAGLQEVVAAQERVEAELAELRSELGARQQAREAAEARLAEAEELCRQRQQRIDEVTAALEEQRGQLETDLAEARRQLDEQRERSRIDLAEAQQRLEDQRTQSESDLAEAQQRLEDQRQQTESDLAEAQQRLEDQRKQSESDLAEARRQLDEQHQACAQLDSQLSDARDLCRQSEELLAEVRSTLEDQRRRAEADLAAAERLAEEQQNACQALETELTEARREREAEQQRVVELTEALERERRQAEADLAAARSRIEQQELAGQALQTRLTQLQEQGQVQDRALTEARGTLTREREAAQQQLEEHASKQQALREGLTEAENRLAEIRDRACELEETLARERQTATVEIETLRQDLERQRAECQGLEEQLAEARRLCDEHGQRVAALEDTLARQREQGETALALAEQQLAERQDKCETLGRELDNARQRCREAQEQVAGLNELIGKERETARAALSEARQQLQHQQHQVQALHVRLVEAKQYDEARDRQIAELKQALGEAAERIVGLEPGSAEQPAAGAIAAPAPREHRWPSAAKAALAAAVVLGLISAGVTTWFYERGPGRPDYRIAGIVSVPSADSELLATCEAMARREKAVQTTVDRDRGVIELSVRTDNPEEGLALVNRIGETIATGALNSLQGPPDAQPAVSEEYRQRREQLAELDQQLAAIANRPATVATEDGSHLLATWRQLRAEQQKVADALTDLAARLNPPAVSDTALQVDDQELARAEVANQQLQADSEALRQREGQLASRLRTALEAGLMQFNNVKEAITATSQQVNSEIEADHPSELDEPLRTMQESLASWSEAVGAARQDWDLQRARFESDKVDSLVAQASLEKAARTFIDETEQTAASFQRALDALGQGDGQVTRRLVLRNTLAKQFSALADAQSGALAATRAVVMSEDVELASIVQRLTGLRQRVEQLRQQTADALRHEKLTDLQKRREQEMSQAHAEHDRLIAAAAELDEALLKTAEQAVQMVTESSAQQSALMEQADLQRRRAEAMRKLLDLQGSPDGKLAGQRSPPPVRFLPAAAPVLSDEAEGGKRLRNALLAGSAPLLAFVVIAGVAAMIVSSRRTSRTMEDYARCLIEAAQQSHDPSGQGSADATDAGETRA